MQQDFHSNDEYLRLLSIMAQLSKLYSDNAVPYLHYRVAENIFCRCFNADNLSRSDTAFDARIGFLGIGLKTFICQADYSLEKIAEFNALSATLAQYKGLALAKELACGRNQRIQLASNLYGIEKSVYHIVARREQEFLLFETDYSPIHISELKLISESTKSLHFTDGINEYSYNHSKSTLFRRFHIPKQVYRLPVSIHHDPYELLSSLSGISREGSYHETHMQFVVLPLYSTRDMKVPERSGLNQWNAKGRFRDYGEIYIPIPSEVRRCFPNFFPPRDTPFDLRIPKGESFKAKVCQENNKALMTNPNKALSDWLLRDLFQLKEGELLTRERQKLLGFDSVIIYKESDSSFTIDIQPLGAYKRFIEEHNRNR